jgi:hypothetical protein
MLRIRSKKKVVLAVVPDVIVPAQRRRNDLASRASGNELLAKMHEPEKTVFIDPNRNEDGVERHQDREGQNARQDRDGASDRFHPSCPVTDAKLTRSLDRPIPQ